MGELINGRTPEQIRFNISECSRSNCLSECPYENRPIESCAEGLLSDALALINRLESERDAALAKVPKWISAKDRQPAPLEKVWMYSKKYNSMFVGMRGLQNPEHIYVESGPDLRLNDISYWMPKPQKPKAPEEEG